MKTKQSIKQKVQKEMPEFASEVEGLDLQQLATRVAAIQQAMSELEDTKEADTDLEAALEVAKELGAPYRDAKASMKLRTKFLVTLMKEKQE